MRNPRRLTKREKASSIPITPREDAALEQLDKYDSRTRVIRYSRIEYRKILAVTEQAMLVGLGIDRTRSTLAQYFPTIGRKMVEKAMLRIREKWAEEDVGERAVAKSSQVRRIQSYIRHAQGEQDQQGNWKREPNHLALARWENLLADIQGTREPIEVKVDATVREALFLVIGRMDPERMNELLERSEQESRLAELAARSGIVDMPPQLPPTGDKPPH